MAVLVVRATIELGVVDGRRVRVPADITEAELFGLKGASYRVLASHYDLVAHGLKCYDELDATQKAAVDSSRAVLGEWLAHIAAIEAIVL